MRSGIAMSLVSIGTILIAFSAVLFVLAFLASQIEARHGLGGMGRPSLGAFVIGAILVGGGVLLSRGGAKSHDGRTRAGP
jgi:hypothetical protein